MKTKNCKVREKDIKAGRKIFRSHPVYGIDELLVAGRPYRTGHDGLFFEAISSSKYGKHRSDYSLDDAGISKGESRNYRRTFFKRKQAEEWAEKMKTDPGFIASQARHERICREMQHSM